MHHSSDLSYNTPQPETTDLQSLQFAMKAAGVGIWDVILTEPRTVVWDDRCKQLFGLTGDNSILYEETLQFIHDDDRNNIITAVQQALNPETRESYDQTFRTIGGNDDKIRWVRFIGKAYFNFSGEPYRFSGIAMEVTAEIKANEKAAAAESLAELAAKGTGIGLFHINIPTNEIDYSAAFSLILTGESNKNLNRQVFIDHIHPEDREGREAAYEAALQSGDLYYEARTIWKDGTVHWIRIVGTYTFDAGGKPTLFSGTVQNITEHRQREHALKEAEERFTLALRQNEAMFRNVTSTSPTGLWMSDEEGKLTYLNKTLADWTGMPYESLLNHGWANAVIEEDRPKAAAAFMNAISSKGHYDVEFRITRGTGEVMWCRAAGDPFYNEDGSYAGYVGFCMDIHERVITANNLKVNEERIRAIIEQAPLAIGLLSGRDMVVETANETILRLWGKDEAIVGLPLIVALPEIKDQQFMGLLESVFDTGEPFLGYGTPALLMREGILQTLYFDFVYTPMRDAHGAITGVMVLATEVTAQVVDRKALEQSESRFRSLIQEAPFATALYTGSELIIEMANEVMIQLWGKDEKVIGMPLHLALPELEGQPFLNILDEVFTSGISYHTSDAKVDLMVGGVLGSYYFNFTYKPLRNEKGEVYAILNMAVEVTAQVLARKALEESELFIRSIIENSPVAKMVFVGEQMVIKTANQNMLQMIGREVSVIGKPFEDVLTDLSSGSFMQKLKHVLYTGETIYQPEEKLEVFKDGQHVTGYYNYIYKALPNISGELYGVTLTATEVTEQVLARQKIMEAEEALRGAIELAELGTWQLDLQSGVMQYSARLRTWFGFKEAEVITIKKALLALGKRERNRITQAIAQAIDPGQRSLYNVEFSVINKTTGRERIIHAYGKAYFNQNGEVYKVSGTAQDVTEQRWIQLALEHEVRQRTDELQSVNEELTATNEELSELNTRLVRSNEELAQYAYVASHDLQEPLRKIQIYSDRLNRQQDLPPENKRLISKVMKSASRMSMLIRDLLEFSRLLNAENLLHQVDLSAVCKAVSSDFELSIQEKDAEIIIGELPVIEGVSLQMNQLFYNLFSNSIKFSAPGKKLRIQVSSKRINREDVKNYVPRPNMNCDYYEIVFADNGIGFDVKYGEQIFEVFKRLHGHDVYPGSGIGLALCRRIVANHNGYLYAVSAPDQGSAFHIILPDRAYKYEES